MNFFQQHFQYTFTGIGNLSAAIFSLSIGAIVLMQQPTSRKHIAFFLVTFAGSIWLSGYAFLNLFRNPDNALMSLRLCYLLGVPYLSPSAYFFSLEWRQRPYQRSHLLISYGFAFILGVFFFLHHEHIVGLKLFSWGRLNFFRINDPIGLTYLAVVVLHMFGYALAAYINLRAGLREATSPTVRKQFRNFIFSFCIGYLSPTDYLVSVGISNYAFGYVTFSLFVATVAYAIARHKFLDVNLTIKRFSLLFFIYSFLFASLLPIVFPILTRVLDQSNKAAFQILGLSMGIGIVLSLGPLIYAYIVRNSFWLRTHFSTGLTHELKSPLSIIQNAAEMSIMNINTPNGDRKQALSYLHMIEENAQRLETYVKNLLHVARHETGRVDLIKASCDFRTLIESAQKIYAPLYDVAGVNLKISTRTSLPVEIDAEKMEQVISNVLSNALKFSAGGTVELMAEIKNNSLAVRVRDEGIGIHSDLQEKIFDRFFQVDAGKKGSGIGLTIAKAWVEAHGGKIWAESEGEGKGATVVFTVPV